MYYSFLPEGERCFETSGKITISVISLWNYSFARTSSDVKNVPWMTVCGRWP